MENTEFIKSESNKDVAAQEIAILRSFPSKNTVDGPKVQFSAVDSLNPNFKDFFERWITHQISARELKLLAIPDHDDWVRREWIEWEINDYWGLHDEKWDSGEIKNVRVFVTAKELHDDK